MKAATLPSPIYGSFECHPARYTDYEAWVCDVDRSGSWVSFNAAEVLFHAGVLSKEKFEKTFRKLKLPPRPSTLSRPSPTPNSKPGSMA
jgi:hypothetical protein